MPTPNDLLAILNHIASGTHTESDIAILRVLLTSSDRQDLLQLGKYGINIGQGQDIYVGGRIYQYAGAEVTLKILRAILQSFQLNTQAGIPENLPPSGVVKFVGRERQLIILHQQLQDNKRVAASAITGMGGVGKSELALQYAQIHKLTYPAGICWLQTRGVGAGPQIVRFGRSRLRLNPPNEDILVQVEFCWTHWPLGEVLVVLDDVTDYEVIKPYLPPTGSCFKVLITTRVQLGKLVKQLKIDVLDESAALALLESLMGAERIQRELDSAKKLCTWLGCLPLGLELMGRYINRKPDLSLGEMGHGKNCKSSG